MTDAVLCAWKSNLENKKIELHYEIEGYDRGEIEEQDLAKILIGILNWGENLVKREEHREIRLKITGSDEPEAVSRTREKVQWKNAGKKREDRQIWSDCYFVQVRQSLI